METKELVPRNDVGRWTYTASATRSRLLPSPEDGTAATRQENVGKDEVAVTAILTGSWAGRGWMMGIGARRGKSASLINIYRPLRLALFFSSPSARELT